MLEIDCGEREGVRLRSDALGGGVLVQGHCNDELWGLATHPKIPEFCTVGELKQCMFVFYGS